MHAPIRMSLDTALGRKLCPEGLGIGLSLGGTIGHSTNPARDIGPLIAHALLPIARKDASDRGYDDIHILGPFVGGALSGALLRVID